MSPTGAESGADDNSDFKRTAVVFIHGQGEQQPTSSVREFADNVWLYDDIINPESDDDDDEDTESNPIPRIFSIRDSVSDLGELTRLVTTRDRFKIKIDFFEFYWAHLITGTKLRHILTFFKILIKRPHSEVPKYLLRVRQLMTWIGLAMCFLIPAFICAVIHSIYVPVGDDYRVSYKGLTYFLLSGALMSASFTVAHYFSDTWTNIARIGVFALISAVHWHVAGFRQIWERIGLLLHLLLMS